MDFYCVFLYLYFDSLTSFLKFDSPKLFVKYGSVYGITTKVFYRIKNTIKCYQCAVDEGMICIILWFGNQCLDSFNFLLFLPLLFWAEWCTGLNVQVSLRDQDFIRHGQLEKQWYKCPCISFTSAIIKQLNNVQQKRLFTVQCAALLCDF